MCSGLTHIMGRRRDNDIDRLHKSYVYIKNGIPDLIYNTQTMAYICAECDAYGCPTCFGSGYIFIDTDVYGEF
jgi:hypothetical protein